MLLWAAAAPAPASESNVNSKTGNSMTTERPEEQQNTPRDKLRPDSAKRTTPEDLRGAHQEENRRRRREDKRKTKAEQEKDKTTTRGARPEIS